MSIELEFLELLHLISSVSKNRVVSRYLNELREHHEPTFIHSLHVATLAVQIGYEMGLPIRQLQTLVYAGMLHDIGKRNVPVALMDKPSNLTEEEFNIIRKHPIDAYYIVREKISFETTVEKEIVQNVCLMHHLKMDGTGYPSCRDKRPAQIDYTDISLECRIITVCDVYDALIEKRPYKKCFSHIEAIEELDNLAKGGQIDMQVVNTLKKLIDENRMLLQTASLEIRYA